MMDQLFDFETLPDLDDLFSLRFVADELTFDEVNYDIHFNTNDSSNSTDDGKENHFANATMMNNIHNLTHVSNSPFYESLGDMSPPTLTNLSPPSHPFSTTPLIPETQIVVPSAITKPLPTRQPETTVIEVVDLSNDEEDDSQYGSVDSNKGRSMAATIRSAPPTPDPQEFNNIAAQLANRKRLSHPTFGTGDLPSIPIFGQAMSFVWKCDVMVENYNKHNFIVDDWRKYENIGDILQYLDGARDERSIAQVRFMKTLEGLRELHPDDQEKLIKGSWIEIFFVRCLMQLDDTGEFLNKKVTN